MATVIKRGDSYKITASCGYSIHGKQVRRHMTWTPAPGMTQRQIEKELERQRVLFDEECKNLNIADGSIKFEAFAEDWFKEYAEPKLKVGTVEYYKKFGERVNAAIGHLRMDKVTTRAVQKFITNLSEPGIHKRTKGGLSPKTIKNHLSYISTIFDYAVTQGVVRTNPCRGVTLPSMTDTELDCYTLEEAQQFIDLLEHEPSHWRTFFILAIFCGFRRGELFGLEWDDIDFDNGIITIRRESLYTKARGIYTDTPKTRSSRRSLKVSESVLWVLRQYKAAQAEEQLKLGDRWKGAGRLFVKWDGSPLNPNSARSWLLRFFERTGMRPLNVHGFRHLNASLQINAGIDIKTVSSSLGHSKVSTTLNIYAHSFAAAQAKAADAVADMLSLQKSKP